MEMLVRNKNKCEFQNYNENSKSFIFFYFIIGDNLTKIFKMKFVLIHW